jgi:hypothetical protein
LKLKEEGEGALLPAGLLEKEGGKEEGIYAL